MPNFSGVWTLQEQFEAITEGNWTGIPFELDGPLYAWGAGSTGQLGIDSVVTESSPVQVGSLNWKQVSTMDAHTLAITENNELYSWGAGNDGRTGHNDTINTSSPVQIGALTTWAQTSAGEFHSSAIKTDGTLWTWGSASSGQLGTNNPSVNVSSPVQVGALTTWSQVSARGFAHSGAVKTDGTLWTWGSNSVGQLGVNSTNNTSSPVQVGSETDWALISVGRGSTFAITTTGELYAWGNNSGGRLGDGTEINKSSPVQIGVLTDWSQVSGGSLHCAAVKTDGTLWTWGRGDQGRLGDGTVINRSSPVQIGALTNWSTVSAGAYHTSAIKTDGTLWGWGRNDASGFGLIGDNTSVSRSSPVQIGSETSWEQVSAGKATLVVEKTSGRTGMS
jgi:alpha-tubulin suppressor-like RCC1 family protein